MHMFTEKSRSTFKNRQSLQADLTVVGTFKNNTHSHTLRLRVHYDSYDFQRWSKVERWNGEQWHEVVHLRGNELRPEEGQHDDANVENLLLAASIVLAPTN